MDSYEGKAKILTKHASIANTYLMRFKDDATAGNGQKHAVFPGKGAINTRITWLLFKYLEAHGIKHHILDQIDTTTLHVQHVDIIPLEVVVRTKVAGSLQKRTGLAYGTLCETPIVEFYYKRDDLGDPLFNNAHIQLMKLASPDNVATLSRQALHIGELLRDLFARTHIDIFDFKLEFGKRPSGEIILADEISPDTCRLRDTQTHAILDKDLFRLDAGDLIQGYNAVLKRLESVLF